MDAAKGMRRKRLRLTQPTNFIGGQVTLCPYGPSRAFGAAAKCTQLKRRESTQPANYIGGQVPPTLLGTQRANFVRDQIVLCPYGPSRALGDRSEIVANVAYQ